MVSALILTSDAVSINVQGRYIASVLMSNGVDAHVFRISERAMADRYVALNSVDYIINVIDPFIFNYYVGKPPMTGVKDVITYMTADGVPYTDLQRQYIRNLCKSTYVIANSQFSKSNLEAIDCHVNEVIPNGIDWVSLSRHVNDLVRYDFSSVNAYNPGLNEYGNNWMMDRKGNPALLGILHRLWSEGVKFTMWLHTTGDVFNLFQKAVRKYVIDTAPGRVIGALITIIPVKQETYFLTTNDVDNKHPVRVTFFGSLKDVGVVFGSSRYALSNSYVEGFGLMPFEANASGRFAIINDLPVWREYLPNDCVFRVPIHATKPYVWGLGWNKLLMTFHIPDFNTWVEAIMRALEGDIRYDPRTCSESVRGFDYRITYRWFVDKLVS